MQFKVPCPHSGGMVLDLIQPRPRLPHLALYNGRYKRGGGAEHPMVPDFLCVTSTRAAAYASQILLLVQFVNLATLF